MAYGIWAKELAVPMIKNKFANIVIYGERFNIVNTDNKVKLMTNNKSGLAINCKEVQI